MRIKDILLVYLKERVIVFPLDCYVNVLISNILNKLSDWGINLDKPLSGKEKYFNFFLEKEILNLLDEFRILYSNLNIKIFTFSKNIIISDINVVFFTDSELVKKKIIKLFKKNCKKYFSDKVPDSVNFESSDLFYKNLKCGRAQGEEVEFLSKLI
jgi:hypothetical protein